MKLTEPTRLLFIVFLFLMSRAAAFAQTTVAVPVKLNEILAVFQRGEILAPDDVRGTAETLREVIVGNGWPSLDSARGKVMFALDNGGALRDAYLNGHPSLRGRQLFASVDEMDPAAAWFKFNDPITEFDRIQRLVSAGFMVRTRADSDTRQSRENDPGRREKAFASGAHFVSTDYPEPNPAFSDYCVQFADRVVARANPVSGLPTPDGIDLEQASSSIVCGGSYGLAQLDTNNVLRGGCFAGHTRGEVEMLRGAEPEVEPVAAGGL